jgi:hypothetical protein
MLPVPDGRERSMTTAPPSNDARATLEELEERTQEVWAAYREGLRGLSGREYDEAELRSWERLQRELEAIAELRREASLVEA